MIRGITDSVELNEFDIEKILRFVRKKRGVDLGSYSKSFMRRRLSHRMETLKVKRSIDYIHYLSKDPKELNHLLEAISINVTEFFRDAEVFTEFRDKFLKNLIQQRKEAKWSYIRMWSAGCASGEEAYSLAILADEVIKQQDKFDTRIYATDIDVKALNEAREGEYKKESLKKVDKKILEKYFMPVYNDAYCVKDSIKKQVRFLRHNLITDAPLKCMDVVFCRNMMIYLTKEEREALIEKFGRSLNKGGYLVIGMVESLWNNKSFSVVSTKHKIYKKII